MKEVKDLQLLIESRYPVIVIETWEEKRALELLQRIGMTTSRPVFHWTVTSGLTRSEFVDAPAFSDSGEPEQVLQQILKTRQPGIYALCDFHPFLRDDPRVIRLLKDIALNHDAVSHTLVLISHELAVPAEIRRCCASFSLALPDDSQLRAIVQEEARRWQQQSGQRVHAKADVIPRLISNLRGLTRDDARRLARGAIIDDNALCEADLPEINRARFDLLDMESVLSFEYDTARFSDVGGLQGLKAWLSRRRDAFVSGAAQRDAPKGILLVGVQGGGKSLAAKAVAGLWHLPLLRLDMGAVYNKFFGESERNLREALALAETMAPCVLWIDEIEKGIASGDNDGGTSRRVLGSLLTWMAERKSPVFLVATANEIDRLPPELIRKGRMDEIFFVDLPSADVREDIFGIHLRLRDQEPQRFDLTMLADASEGFTGAEIEQAIVSALYNARARALALSSALLLEEIGSTVPLSITMAERIAALRHWCHGRAVPADGLPFAGEVS
ncbi:MAG: AAA family ATPase [Alcanivoracaceae bacterium]